MVTDGHDDSREPPGNEKGPGKRRKKVVPDSSPEIVSVSGDPFPVDPPKPAPGEVWVTLLDSSPWSAAGPSASAERGGASPVRPAVVPSADEAPARWSEPIWRLPTRTAEETSETGAVDPKPAETPAAPEAAPREADVPDAAASTSAQGARPSLAELAQLAGFTADAVAPVVESASPSEDAEPAEPEEEPMVEAAFAMPELEVRVVVDAFETGPEVDSVAEEAVSVSADAKIAEVSAAFMEEPAGAEVFVGRSAVDLPAEEMAVASEIDVPLVVEVMDTEPEVDPAPRDEPGASGTAPAAPARPVAARSRPQGAVVREVPVEDLLGGVIGLAGSAVSGVASIAFGFVEGLVKGGRGLGKGLLAGTRRLSAADSNCGNCVKPECSTEAKDELSASL